MTSSSVFNQPLPKKFVVVKDFGSGSESPSAEDTDTDTGFPESPRRMSELPAEYWSVLKAMKYMKHGNQSACLAALSCILECDLRNNANLAAISDQDGLEMLVNMLEVNDIRCRVGTLELMKTITLNKLIVSGVVHMGIVPILVRQLNENATDVLQYTCMIIRNISHKRSAARGLRKCGAIPLLVTLLKVKKDLLLVPDESLSFSEKDQLSIAKYAGHALWGLSKYTKNKMAMMRTGMIPIMSAIILSGKKSISVPMTGVLCECSSILWFQLAIETEGLVGVLLNELKGNDPETQRLCSSALMSAADGNPIVRQMLHFHDGLRTLMNLLRTVDSHKRRLLAAVLGVVWKSAINVVNAKRLRSLEAIPLLVGYIDEADVNVRTNAVGALAELAKCPDNRKDIVKRGAVPHLIHMLGISHPQLLANVAHALGELAQCPEGMDQLQVGDGVRLLWSLLKSPNRLVRVRGLWALQPCVRFAKDSGELVRSLTGSLGLLMSMLNVYDAEMLGAVCAVVAEVATDNENLAVMTEHGVVALLSDLATREGDEPDNETLSILPNFSGENHKKHKLWFAHTSDEVKDVVAGMVEDPFGRRRELCSAIANCCQWPDNQREFGQRGVIGVITTYLETKDSQLLAQACRALHALSHDSLNCVAMHGCGVVTSLLRAIASSDQVTQQGAAGCLANIRRFLLCVDRRRTNEKKIE